MHKGLVSSLPLQAGVFWQLLLSSSQRNANVVVLSPSGTLSRPDTVTIIMIPHLHRRLQGRCALPFVRRCRLENAINESRHLTAENFCVELERLLGQGFCDEVTRRCV